MSRRIVVIGGGLAGAAAAWGLARRGHAVTLIEKESRPGIHASGRNAGMVRRVVSDPAIAALARRGADLLATPPAEVSRTSLVRQTGSVLLGDADLRAAAEDAAAAGTGTTIVSAADAERIGELLEAGSLPGASSAGSLAAPPLLGLTPSPGLLAAVTPRDGVADPHEVLTALLEAAKAHGARVQLGTPAALLRSPEGLCGVLLEGEREPLPADAVINAAGPWAAALATDAGGLTLELVSYRRHLLYTGPLPQVDPNAPWVWDELNGFYLRPESAGLLLCACDRDERPPEDTQAEETVARERVASKLAALAPDFEDLPVARCWAGLRSFAPDERFVIGADPQLAGLYWLTGLGGHGLTTSLALADLIADSVEGLPNALAAPFDPARFVREAAGELAAKASS